MAVQTPTQIIAYYVNLLIIQYNNKQKAINTIAASVTNVIIPDQPQQVLTFAPTPTSGFFTLSIGGGAPSAPLFWDDNVLTIETALQASYPMANLSVTGSFLDGFTIDFVGWSGAPPPLFIVDTNTLALGSVRTVIKVTDTSTTIPLAVENGFNLLSTVGTETGLALAVGAQLDILGEYVGAFRSADTPEGSITLSDSDFITLIKFAIVKNNGGSSLQTIEKNLYQFFPGQFVVTDFKNMNLSYMFVKSLGSSDLFRVLIQEKFIPRPMGVGLSLITPVFLDEFFGFRTYGAINPVVKPFNNYDVYNTAWKFLSYSDAIII